MAKKSSKNVSSGYTDSGCSSTTMMPSQIGAVVSRFIQSTTSCLSKIVNETAQFAAIGESTSGKKDALIWRIVNNADASVIARYCPEKLYMLSEMGQAFLRDHNDYVMVHKHKNWGIDWKEYDMRKVPGQSYYDTMWAIFNEQLANNPRDFGRSQYLFMYQLNNR